MWRNVLSFVFLSSLHFASSQVAGSYKCPTPWLPFQDECYKFVMLPNSLQTAVDTCETDGASLVSINSMEEHEFVAKWLDDHDKQGIEWYTSGRRDPDNPDGFIWSSIGDKVTGTQFWLNSDSRTREGDVIVYHTNGRDWGWEVSASTSDKPFICEINKGDLYKIMAEERGYDYGLDETAGSSYEMGPAFYIQPEHVLFDTGSDSNLKVVSMECAADGHPSPYYTWHRIMGPERTPVNPRSEPRFTIINGKLIINEPKDTKDNGQYECVATNRYGSILSNSATMAFGYLNDFPKSERDPVTAFAYSGVGIECNPPKHSYPKISYSWYKDDFRNFIRPALKPYIFVSSDGKLYFSSVTKDDAGSYFCLVTRPLADSTVQGGKLSTPIRLNIIESIGSEQEPDIINGFPKVFPSSPKVGDNLRIECIAWGTALTGSLEYSWSKDGGVLPAEASQEDHNRVLNIPNVQLMHGGVYRCTVKRHTGQSTSGTVQVLIEATPFFTIPLKNRHVDHLSNLRWRCNGQGIPTVTYQWYLNATEIETAIEEMKPEDRARYSVSKRDLSISGVLPRDAGMYQCAASNSRGTRYSSAQLRVLSFSPRYNKYPLQPNQYGTLGGSVTISCQPEAAPYPEKVWFKDNRPLNPAEDESARIHVLANGNLVLTSIRRSDAATYKCEAANIHGTTSSSGNLTVLPTTTISNPPKDMVVIVNQTAFFDCEASFNPTVDLAYDWWHNHYHIEFIKLKNLGNTMYKYIEPYYERGSGINSGGLFIRHAQFFHAGEYTCIARSSSYELSDSATLQVIGPPSEPAGVFSPDVVDVKERLTGTRLALSWWPGANNGRMIQSYIVEGKHTFANYWQQMKLNVPHNVGSAQDSRVETVLDDLTPFSVYTFRVSAVNILGTGEASAPSPEYTTGSAKPNVTVQNIGGGGGKVGDLTITWDLIPIEEHNGPGLGYKVMWKKSYMIDEDWEVGIISDVDLRKKGKGGRFVTLVGEKNFFRAYDAQVLAYNDEGAGPAIEDSYVEIMSAENIPSSTPTNVQAVYFNSTAITVEWRPVENNRDNMKGVLIGYRINYWIRDWEDETMALFNFVQGQRDSGRIIGLRPNTYYIVNVQAINSAGNGPKSEVYTTRTLRAAPLEAPQEVQVFPVEADKIEVRWRGVSTEIDEEPLEGYKVRYFQRGENIYVATDIDAGKTTHMEIGGFQINTVYDLRVFGYSRGGDGLQSSPTLEFVLGPNCYVIEDSPDKEYIYRCSACACQTSILLVLFSSFLHFLLS